MVNKKYINTKELAELTGRPYDEILNLARTGVLPCHRTRRGHYRLNVDAVEKYFGVQVNKPKEDMNEKSDDLTITEFRNICREQQGMFREMIGEPMGVGPRRNSSKKQISMLKVQDKGNGKMQLPRAAS